MLPHTYARLALFALGTLGCSGPRMEIVDVGRNPTSCVLPVAVEMVDEAVREAFSGSQFRGMDLTVLPTGPGVRLSTFHEPISLSPAYRVAHKPLPYLAEFSITYASTPDGTGTRVTVTASGTEVIVGKTSGFLNPHGSGNIYKRVLPTTIEEYEILSRIAERVGHPLPAPVTPMALLPR